MTNRRNVLLVVVVAVIASLRTTMAGDGLLPDSRRTDWTYTGVPGGIPRRTRICATFAPGVTALDVNAAIRKCGNSGGGVVALEAGTFELSGIRVDVSDVTLRGAGADRTVLKGTASIVSLGGGLAKPVAIPIIRGGAKDSRSIAVATLAGLSPNLMIELDRDDDDLVVSTKGGARYTRQVNMIVSMKDDTLILKNPLLADYSVPSAQVKFTFNHISLSGIEDLKLDYSAVSTGANLMWSFCYACWVKGVESYKAAGYHITMTGTVNSELRDSFIHDSQTYGPNNAGIAAYGNGRWGSNSSAKIENNIFDRVFPGIELQNSSSGFYVGYNYGHGTMSQATNGPVTWMFSDNHGPHDRMNLWEGNVAEMFGSDGYFGGSSHGTVLRNYFTGVNPLFGTVSNPIRLNRLSYAYNLIGNVLGSSELRSTKYQETKDGCGRWPEICNAIYRLGYPNIGNASLIDNTGMPVPGGMAYPDVKVADTLLRWGNYDYFNKVAQWNRDEVPGDIAAPRDRSLPASYVYSIRPPWFGTVPWPPIGPDIVVGDGDASGHVNRIPAQVCWERWKLGDGAAFNPARCYSVDAQPGAPSSLRLRK